MNTLPTSILDLLIWSLEVRPADIQYTLSGDLGCQMVILDEWCRHWENASNNPTKGTNAK